MTLRYTKPAEKWTEALPLGNGRLAMMVYGGMNVSKIRLGEETLWDGRFDPYADNPLCASHLPEIREAIFSGDYRKGEELTGEPRLVPESASVCPRKLVRVSGEDMTAEELVSKIEKNIPILNMSGGGVTFSGGEPLMHADFVLRCMELLRGKTSRALQTCGYADTDDFLRVLKECDYVLYDLKQMDDEIHRRYTGVSNERILEHYRLLSRSGVPFTTRIPLIPTVNDTVENIEATARFLSECGVPAVELLPYNKMAGGKYLMLGRSYEPQFDGSIPPDPHKDIFHRYGVEVKIL